MNNKNRLVVIIVICFLFFVCSVIAIFGLIHISTTFFKTENVIKDKGAVITTLKDMDVETESILNKVYDNYDDYYEVFDNTTLTKEDFEKNNYYIFSIQYDSCAESDFQLISYKETKDEIDLEFSYEASCGVCAPEYLVYAYKMDNKMKDPYFKLSYKARNNPDCPQGVAYKPMIYIYPEEDMEVEVRLGNSDLLTTTYPKYLDSWNVLAHPNGTLEYNGRNYYGLYWEGANHANGFKRDGFVVSGEDTSEFLEEKLELLGLNSREINEFMVYWLPRMEDNNYNYIRFETEEEIEEYMPLEVTPEPDTLIRVFMDYKPLDRYIRVREQELVPVTREGYTVIEWGGGIIK